MPFCPSCGAEFRAGFTQCNTCLVPLVASLEALDEEPGEEEAEFETALHLLSEFTDESHAVLVRHLLDEAGIPSVLQGGHARTVESCQPYRLFVEEAHVEVAQETLESYRSPSLVTGEIEGHLDRLQGELRRIGREYDQVAPHLRAVQENLERLRTSLRTLDNELDGEE